GEIDKPRRLSISDTRTWPQAGCSIAKSTAACSISGAVRFFNTGLRRLVSCSASSPPVVQLLEAVEAVPAVAPHLAGLAHIAELLGQLEQTDLGADDLLFLRHSRRLRSGCRRAGRGPNSG